MKPLTHEDVQTVLAPLGIEIRFFETSTATSQLAADNIGCQLGQIVKSLCFIVQDEPVLVLASGDVRIDDKKLGEKLGVGRRQVKVASPEQCVEIFGYEPGGVPPIAHRTMGLRLLIDASLDRYELVYAAGGARNAIFPITLAQLRELTGGESSDLAKAAVTDRAGS